MNYTAVIEYCRDTGLYVGYVPGFSGAHSQGRTLEELNANLSDFIYNTAYQGNNAVYL